MFRNFNTNINLKIKCIFRLFNSLSKSTNTLFILKFYFLFSFFFSTKQTKKDQTITNGRKTHFYGGISTAIEDLTGLNKLDRSHFSIHTRFVCSITHRKDKHTLTALVLYFFLKKWNCRGRLFRSGSHFYSHGTWFSTTDYKIYAVDWKRQLLCVRLRWVFSWASR